MSLTYESFVPGNNTPSLILIVDKSYTIVAQINPRATLDARRASFWSSGRDDAFLLPKRPLQVLMA